MVVNAAEPDGDEGGLQDNWTDPSTRLQGWRRFVDADPAVFGLLPEQQWQAMPPQQRDAYDEARIAYHSELQVVRTSTVKEIAHQGRLLTLLNQREHGARRGMIVSGEWTTGKTTALKQLGRTHELRVRQRYPGGDRIPVVYITAPPKGSPRKLAMEFARFLGLPVISPRHNTIDVTSAVCQVLIEARTDLVLVDEIHLLNHATTAGEDLSDHLKYFTEHLPATFVYAGINVEKSGLFTGIRGKQLAGRCIMVRTGPFPFTSEWRALVASLQNTLCLHRHQAGTLVKQSKYLHQRTGGMIGSLSHLIRAAAISAILDGSERITKTSLRDVRIDHNSESDAPPEPPRAVG
ncbi:MULTISPECIES: ATP-binding protein [unclassified Streptomyces]|uniref:ATP-binding protein n=1 Tax=unclassified Streptomyces TaxID=2593676 RepID=UPI002251A7C3|nr:MULTISPECIES: ATP-binding protein [unclassified Streptomyces]MCX5056101.1 AAA family ATPase [Streptomyces sp. NBC_00452]MCX5287206.1 AAA family ATPase [Streptomyces sp. NBC_00183]